MNETDFLHCIWDVSYIWRKLKGDEGVLLAAQSNIVVASGIFYYLSICPSVFQLFSTV